MFLSEITFSPITLPRGYVSDSGILRCIELKFRRLIKAGCVSVAAKASPMAFCLFLDERLMKETLQTEQVTEKA